MPGSSGQQTSTQTTTPPSWAIPYWKGSATTPGILPQAAALYQSSMPSYFPGQTVAQQTPEQIAALQGMATRATEGSPLVQGSQDYLNSVISGDYLNRGQPGSDLTNSLWASVAPQIQSQFGGAGRLGSGSEEQALGTSFTNAIAPYAYGAYQNERQLQQQAAGMAPTLANQDYVDLSQLYNVGQTNQQMNQQNIQAAIDRFNFEQNLPQAKLNAYEQNVAGLPASTTATSVSGPSALQTALGGALGIGGLLTAPWTGGSTVGSSLFSK